MYIEDKFFIGRETELSCIVDAINSTEKVIVSISGEGGIGKTSLLRQVLNITISEETVVLPIIDFFEVSTHEIEGLLAKIVENIQKIVPFAFKTYTDSIREYEIARLLGQEVIQLAKLRHRAIEDFFKDYLQLASNKRLILLFDTFEIVHNREVGEWFLNNLEKYDNSVLVIAGRTNYQWHSRFERSDKYEFIPLILSGFSEKEVEHFLLSNEEYLSDSAIEKINILSRGRPIVLALAVEWLKRNRVYVNLSNSEAAFDLERIPDAVFGEGQRDFEAIRRDFERSILQNILDLQENDEIVLMMAYVHRRFDKEILTHLLHIDIYGAKKLLESIQDFPYVKYFEDLDNYALHDEMRRMLVEHIWPVLDPTCKEERTKLSKVMVEYYLDNIQRLNQDLEVLQRERETATISNVDAKADEDILFRIALKKRRLNQLEAERIYYEIMASPETGLDDYRESIEGDIWAHEFAAARLKHIEKQLAIQEWDETPYLIFYAKLESDAEKKLTQAKLNIFLPDGRPEESYLLLRQLQVERSVHANLLLKSDVQLSFAILYYYHRNVFRQREEILPLQILSSIVSDVCCDERFNSQLSPREILRRDRILAQTFNLQGLIYRSRGFWDLAQQSYEKSLEYCTTLTRGAKQYQAATLNNLAYIYGLLGYRNKALDYCEASLRKRKELHLDYEYALSLNTNGLILANHGQPFQALTYCQNALKIFVQLDDHRGVGLANHAMARAYRLQVKLSKDEHLLIKAEEHLKEAFSVLNKIGDFYSVEVLKEFAFLYWEWAKFYRDYLKDNTTSRQHYILTKQYLDKAITGYQDLEATPEMIALLLERAKLYGEQQKTSFAYDDLQEAVKLLGHKTLHKESLSFQVLLSKLECTKGYLTFLEKRYSESVLQYGLGIHQLTTVVPDSIELQDVLSELREMIKASSAISITELESGLEKAEKKCKASITSLREVIEAGREWHRFVN